MRIKNNHFRRFLSIVAAFTLLFIFFVNVPRVDEYKKYVRNGANQQSCISEANIELVEIVCNDETLSAESQGILHNNYRTSISIKNLRTILMVCVQICMLLFVQFRILWVSENTTTRSQKSIIQYVHNKDGQKS